MADLLNVSKKWFKALQDGLGLSSQDQVKVAKSMVPVYPWLPMEAPLHVHPHGWWRGGQVQNTAEGNFSQVRFQQLLIDTTAANTVFTIFTPATGKTAYITNFTVQASVAETADYGDNISGLLANGSTANNVFRVVAAADTLYSFAFVVPLQVSTAFKGFGNGATNARRINVVWFEEETNP